MLHPIKVVDIELTQPLPVVDGLEGYFGVRAILRLRAVPVAYLDCPVVGGRCDPGLLARRILDNRVWEILTALVREGLLADPVPPRLDVDALLALPSASDRFWRDHLGEAPMVTVAVCTRDRASDLAICLDALRALDYPALDVLVVDNAPSNEETATLVATRFPSVRYIREPRPGLDWARNRAILEARGEIIAYTDDDVVVDPGWVKALARAFMEHSEVMGVAGLVVPFSSRPRPRSFSSTTGGSAAASSVNGGASRSEGQSLGVGWAPVSSGPVPTWPFADACSKRSATSTRRWMSAPLLGGAGISRCSFASSRPATH